MRSHLFFVVIASILYSNNLPAQLLRETEFTCYTRVEGLSNNFITGIVQDSTGYIWVATNRGLNRFDGRFFANYYTGSADLRHLQVMNVSQRENILIHPANDAMHELKGCIAPVCFITGAGKGIRSRMALKTLTSLVYGALDQHDQVFITIKSDPYESA